jgi:hypothetical protein
MIAIEPRLTVQVKFLGRDNGDALRDGVLLSVEEFSAPWAT